MAIGAVLVLGWLVLKFVVLPLGILGGAVWMLRRGKR